MPEAIHCSGNLPPSLCADPRNWRRLTNIGASQGVIGEPTFADAILDRIIHNAYRIELEGQSMRKTIAKMDDETPQS